MWSWETEPVRMDVRNSWRLRQERTSGSWPDRQVVTRVRVMEDTGAAKTIDYRTWLASWASGVLRLMDGKGGDRVVDVGGWGAGR